MCKVDYFTRNGISYSHMYRQTDRQILLFRCSGHNLHDIRAQNSINSNTGYGAWNNIRMRERERDRVCETEREGEIA